MNHDEILGLISEAYEYCEKLYSGMKTLTDNIDKRNLVDLEIYFKNILEGFNWVFQIAVSVADIHGEKLDLKNIHQKVNMYIEAYNNLDLLLVRDIVEYELMQQVEVFYNIFNKTLNILQNAE